jgi:hypothetical protein
MTYTEIIQKLKDSGISLENFAYEVQPYNFADFPEALEAQKVRAEFRKLHCANGWDSPESEVEYAKLPDEYKILKKLYRQQLGLEWEEVEQHGGEGKGSSWWSVKYFPKEDIYIKVKGYYESYNGTDFYGGYDDTCSEVKPEEKTIIVYESVK